MTEGWRVDLKKGDVKKKRKPSKEAERNQMDRER